MKLNINETRFTLPNTENNANIHGQQIMRASIGKMCVVEHLRSLSVPSAADQEEGKIEFLE